MKVKKEKFVDRLERRMKSWRQEQHEKKIFGDPEKEEVVWKIVELEGGGVMRRPFKKQYENEAVSCGGLPEGFVSEWEFHSESQKMQDQLEPIWNTTEHDESDDLEDAKRVVKRSKVYDGWFWNGHLHKFERWEESQNSMKTKDYKKWYNRGS